jgi:type II secretory pathway pseudopilin PulG
MTTHSLNARRNGFSLFEMLMFIAFLGVLTGVLMPLLSPNGEYAASRSRRNAQEICMVYSAARIAGLNFAGSSLEVTIRNVMAGGKPTNGAFKDHKFAVSTLSDADIAGAAAYLKVSGEDLIYTPNKTTNSSSALASLGSSAKQTPSYIVPAAPAAPIKWSLPATSSPSQAAGTRLRARL